MLRRGADDFVWIAECAGRTVTFLLNRLEQRLPKKLCRGAAEVFVQRTFDESGLGFVLLFDDHARRFLWVLDEEQPVPEHWRELAPGLLQGRRTGFVFQQRASRKELVAVRGQSVDRNDFYDGPFDQLADNYASQSPLRKCLEKWRPLLRGRIDDLGRFIDAEAPARVAIVPYQTYYTNAEAVRAGATSGAAELKPESSAASRRFSQPAGPGPRTGVRDGTKIGESE